MLRARDGLRFAINNGQGAWLKQHFSQNGYGPPLRENHVRALPVLSIGVFRTARSKHSDL